MMENKKEATKGVSLKERIRNYFLPKGIQLDMLRYRPNKCSYVLGLMAALLLAVGFCVFYSGTEISTLGKEFSFLGSKNPGPWQGVDIVINILSMLFLFLCAVKMESYSLSLGIASIALGAFALIRSYLLPLALTIQGSMAKGIFVAIVIFYSVSGFCSILAGFLAIYRGSALRKYLKSVKPIENEKV